MQARQNPSLNPNPNPPKLRANPDDGSYASVGSSLSGESSIMRFRRLAPHEDPEGLLPTVNIIVMEVGGGFWWVGLGL